MGCGASSSRANNYGASDTKTPDRAAAKGDASVAVLPTMHTTATGAVCHAGKGHPNWFISGGEDGEVAVYNLDAAEVLYSWNAHDKSVNEITCSLTNDVMCTASRDLSIKVWQLGETTSPRAVLSGHTLTVSSVDLVPDGTKLCSGGRDTSVRIWDVEAAKQTFMAKISQNLVTCMKWLHDDLMTFVQGGEDLRLRIWDSRTGGLKPVQTWEGYVYFPLDLDVSADGNYIFTSSKGFNSVGCEGKLWDRRMGRILREYVGHKQDATSCIFLEPPLTNKQLVATASKDSSIRIWDVQTGECVINHIENGAGMFTALDHSLVPGSCAQLYATAFHCGVFAYNIGDSSLKIVARTAKDDRE